MMPAHCLDYPQIQITLKHIFYMLIYKPHKNIKHTIVYRTKIYCIYMLLGVSTGVNGYILNRWHFAERKN